MKSPIYDNFWLNQSATVNPKKSGNIFDSEFDDVIEFPKFKLFRIFQHLNCLVAENKEKEAKQKENMKVKFEALTSSSMLDDYFTSDSTDYSYGSTLLRGEVTVLSGKACEGGHVEILIFGAFSDSCEKFSFLSGFEFEVEFSVR